MRLGQKGVWSLPVVLTLGLVLTASVLSVGFACAGMVNRARQRQAAIEDFNAFLERIQMLGIGGVGGTGRLELKLEGEIILEGGLAGLVVGGENIRFENLPLTISGVSSLSAGCYRLELKREDGDVFIEIAAL